MKHANESAATPDSSNNCPSTTVDEGTDGVCSALNGILFSENAADAAGVANLCNDELSLLRSDQVDELLRGFVVHRLRPVARKDVLEVEKPSILFLPPRLRLPRRLRLRLLGLLDF